MDERKRRLERQAAQEKGGNALLQLLRERLRSGEISREQLEHAALLGSQEAAATLNIAPTRVEVYSDIEPENVADEHVHVLERLEQSGNEVAYLRLCREAVAAALKDNPEEIKGLEDDAEAFLLFIDRKIAAYPQPIDASDPGYQAALRIARVMAEREDRRSAVPYSRKQLGLYSSVTGWTFLFNQTPENTARTVMNRGLVIVNSIEAMGLEGETPLGGSLASRSQIPINDRWQRIAQPVIDWLLGQGDAVKKHLDAYARKEEQRRSLNQARQHLQTNDPDAT